jgi:hypothetical protein
MSTHGSLFRFLFMAFLCIRAGLCSALILNFFYSQYFISDICSLFICVFAANPPACASHVNMDQSMYLYIIKSKPISLVQKPCNTQQNKSIHCFLRAKARRCTTYKSVLNLVSPQCISSTRYLHYSPFSVTSGTVIG